MTNMTTKQEQEVQIARLEERITGIGDTVREIKTNHLVHIAADIKRLEIAQNKTNLKIAQWSGSVGAVIVLINILLKVWRP